MLHFDILNYPFMKKNHPTPRNDSITESFIDYLSTKKITSSTSTVLTHKWPSHPWRQLGQIHQVMNVRPLNLQLAHQFA